MSGEHRTLPLPAGFFGLLAMQVSHGLIIAFLIPAIAWSDEAIPAASPEADREAFHFAVIGDFGFDLLKPKTAAKTAEAAKTSDSKTKEDDDEEDHEKPAVKALPAPSVPYQSSKEQRNPSQAAVARLVKSWDPEFVVTTGDNNYPKGEADSIDDNIGKYYGDFIGNYRGSFGNGSKENRFFPVLGNHDWDSPKTKCQAYLDYFSLPGNERYYEFKRGPLHFIMLDNDGREPDGVKVGSKQYEWCKEVLSKSTSPFQIVVAHHPPYSSGSHGGIPAANWEFDDMGVDLMLCGHDHNYERLEHEGLTYIVNGAGGANLRSFKKIDPGSKVRYYEKHGAMRIDVSLRNKEWVLESRFVNIEGKEIDRFEVRRSENGVVASSSN